MLLRTVARNVFLRRILLIPTGQPSYRIDIAWPDLACIISYHNTNLTLDRVPRNWDGTTRNGEGLWTWNETWYLFGTEYPGEVLQVNGNNAPSKYVQMRLFGQYLSLSRYLYWHLFSCPSLYIQLSLSLSLSLSLCITCSFLSLDGLPRTSVGSPRCFQVWPFVSAPWSVQQCL